MAVQARNVNTLRTLYPNEYISVLCSDNGNSTTTRKIFFANKIGSTLKQENGFIINRCS